MFVELIKSLKNITEKLFHLKWWHLIEKILSLHWLIEWIPEGFWRLPYARWYLTVAFVEKKILSRYFLISLGVVRSLPWGPRGLAVWRLPRMQEVVGLNPTEGKICFSHFTLLEWNVKNCFVKLIKTLKNNKKNYLVLNDDILLKCNYILIKYLFVFNRKSNFNH